MPLTPSFALPSRLGRKIDLACTSCAWSAAIALLILGLLVTATAAILLGFIAIHAWHYGWTARLVTLVLFLSSPVVTSTAFFDYRSTRNLESTRKRVACLGVSLAILGGLELILAISALYLLAAIGVGYIY